MERTFAMIKPDAVAAGSVGPILARIAEEGFRVIGMRMLRMSLRDAEGFYAVHSERPFFGDLTAFMSSGACVVLAMERENAIAHWRTTMGATNPEEAAVGTLRKLFASNIEKNAVHGSDAPETAAEELSYFFRGVELRV
jgi:nucleoside-diphosphate kinase